jgi:5-methylthioribose kinase
MAERQIDGGRVPRILFEDVPTFAIAMEAAPEGAGMWKTQLFKGVYDRAAARIAGTALGSIIAASWHDEEALRLFGDRTVFEQLRIDPYYRYTASRIPEAADYIHGLIDVSAARKFSLVHGDWSPKNLLVDDGRLWVIDWEVVHFGDPSFDVGFLLNHLLLKSIAMPQSRGALAELAMSFLEGLENKLPPDAGWLAAAGFAHLPALLLARVEGKSPAEYLDATMRARTGKLALELMHRPAVSIEELFTR